MLVLAWWFSTPKLSVDLSGRSWLCDSQKGREDMSDWLHRAVSQGFAPLANESIDCSNAPPDREPVRGSEDPAVSQ